MILHQDHPRGQVVNSYGCTHRRSTRRRCRDCQPPKAKRWETEPPYYTWLDLFELVGTAPR